VLRQRSCPLDDFSCHRIVGEQVAGYDELIGAVIPRMRLSGSKCDVIAVNV
jgi:hypothetical protein